MTDKKFTPGPWQVAFSGVSLDGKVEPMSLCVSGSRVQSGCAGSMACVCSVSPPTFTTDEDYCNAQLIASAPDMLEALEAFIEADNTDGINLAYEMAKAAIAKAYGQPAA